MYSNYLHDQQDLCWGNTLQFEIMEREGLNKKGGGATDTLNINKQGGKIKGGGLKIVLGQKWQPVTTNYGVTKNPKIK